MIRVFFSKIIIKSYFELFKDAENLFSVVGFFTDGATEQVKLNQVGEAVQGFEVLIVGDGVSTERKRLDFLELGELFEFASIYFIISQFELETDWSRFKGQILL